MQIFYKTILKTFIFKPDASEEILPLSIEFFVKIKKLKKKLISLMFRKQIFFLFFNFYKKFALIKGEFLLETFGLKINVFKIVL